MRESESRLDRPAQVVGTSSGRDRAAEHSYENGHTVSEILEYPHEEPSLIVCDRCDWALVIDQPA